MRTVRFAICLALTIAAVPAHAQEQRIAEIPGRPGIAVRLLLVEPAVPPHAAVLLFNGGPGIIRLWAPSATPLEERYARGNFLLRSRVKFAARGLRVGAIDVPYEMRDRGMSAIFRRSADHAADVAAAVKALRGPENLPVWLVGTSMGTVSAAAAAVRLGEGIDGLVLTSSITRAIGGGINWLPEATGIMAFDLKAVTVPVFVLGHEDDECYVTPPGDIPGLVRQFTRSRRVGSHLVEGGLPPETDDCEALAAHGFYGAEKQAVDAIADFIEAAH
ncbi:MAG: hypothetical protein HY059_16435 [Proteobacteria bacterium]|nr:hypothetical protein [Pseudomonadota bacterium]